MTGNSFIQIKYLNRKWNGNEMRNEGKLTKTSRASKEEMFESAMKLKLD